MSRYPHNNFPLTTVMWKIVIRSTTPTWTIAVIIALTMAIPLVYLFVRAAQADQDAWNTLTTKSTYTLLRNTLLLTLAVSGTSVVIALPIAWLTIRSDLYCKKFWSVVTMLPLVIPSFVGGLVFMAALSPNGSLQRILEPIGIDSLPNIYGFMGAWLILSLFTYPYLLITLRAGLRKIDPTLEESSRTLGFGPWTTFRKVIIPQLRIPFGMGILLVSLYVISDFGAVSLLRYDTLTIAIFSKFGTFDRAGAVVLSLLLVAIMTVVLYSESFSRRRGDHYATSTANPPRPKLIRLGKWGWLSTALLVFLAVLALGLPMAVLGDWIVRGIQAGEGFNATWNAAWNSVSVSSVTALIAIALSIPVATVAVRHKNWFATLIERMSFIGFALPGIVVALSIVFFSLNIIPTLYQSWPLLLAGYIVLFLPQAIGPVRSNMELIKPSLEESARSLGFGTAWVTATVTIPLLLPGLIGGFILVFLTTMKELPVTLLLSPIEFNTLATKIWGSASEAFFSQAAGPALMLILLSAIPMAVVLRREYQIKI